MRTSRSTSSHPLARQFSRQLLIATGVLVRKLIVRPARSYGSHAPSSVTACPISPTLSSGTTTSLPIKVHGAQVFPSCASWPTRLPPSYVLLHRPYPRPCASWDSSCAARYQDSTSPVSPDVRAA